MPDLVLLLLLMALRIISLLCLFRFLFQLADVLPSIPLVASVLRATDPMLRHVRKSLPSNSRIDTASFLGAVLTTAITMAITLVPDGNLLYFAIASLYQALIYLLYICCWIFIICIFAGVVISWIAPTSTSPNVVLLRLMGNFLLRPIQRVLPNLGGLDFSPAVVLLILVTVLNRVIPWLNGLII